MALDLHAHSTFSDGLLSPQALCALAQKKQVHVIALCDHDTTDGLIPMAQAAQALVQQGYPLRSIASVELSAGEDGRTHILGYGVDPAHEALRASCAALRHKRASRGLQMVEALRDIGIEVPQALLPSMGSQGQAFGRPHIARALIHMGIVHTVDQAFDRYLNEGRPGYVPLAHQTASEAVALLREAGAVPVLAHPLRLHLSPELLEPLILSLRDAGLMGVEVFHPSAGRRDGHHLLGIAQRNGLLVTGGSDFHGDRGARAKLGGLPTGWQHWQEDLAALEEAMARCG